MVEAVKGGRLKKRGEHPPGSRTKNNGRPRRGLNLATSIPQGGGGETKQNRPKSLGVQVRNSLYRWEEKSWSGGVHLQPLSGIRLRPGLWTREKIDFILGGLLAWPKLLGGRRGFCSDIGERWPANSVGLSQHPWRCCSIDLQIVGG